MILIYTDHYLMNNESNYNVSLAVFPWPDMGPDTQQQILF